MTSWWSSLKKPVRQLIKAFLISMLFSVLLLVGRMIASETTRYWFLVWNLFLGVVPLVLAALIVARLERRGWRDWLVAVLGLLWLFFLPNSFYLITDLIHLRSTGEVNILYDAVLFCSFIFNAYIAGYVSVYFVHRALQFYKDTRRYAHIIVGLVFLLCGFAIYLGRYLRWNSWDMVMNPFGILFDLTDNLINPLAHPQVVVTTCMFFGLLSTSYAVLYYLTIAIKSLAIQSKQ